MLDLVLRVCRRAALWARPLVHPVSLPVELERSSRPRGLGRPGKSALGSGAVGQAGSLLSSASALGPGLDLGFLFLLACCDPAPACSLQSATSRPELGFLDASSLCGELTRDAGRCQLHNSRFPDWVAVASAAL